MKELRGLMRGWRAFAILTGFLTLLSLGVGGIFLFLDLTGLPLGAVTRLTMGRTIFGLITSLELLMICFSAPALAAGAITAEKEHQTYELLRATPLSARAIVLGKLFSALVFTCLLLFAALPLQSLTFWIGGVLPSEVVLATLLLLMTALTFCAVGVFFSSLFKRTMASTVLTYLVVGLTVFGLPILIFLIFIGLTFALGGDLNTLSALQAGFWLTIGWILVSLNPIATAIGTEIILLQGHSLYLYPLALENGSSFPIPSPWMGYLIFSLVFSTVLIWISIRLVAGTIVPHRREKA